MPEDEDVLWDWLDGLDDASRMALLAHCVSLGVNALYEKADRYGVGVSASGIQRRIAQADRLARAVSPDMAEAGWRLTVDNYLGRVPKARILEAVRAAKGEQPAQLIDHLKKADMAREAERMLEGTGWLPEPLRTPDSMLLPKRRPRIATRCRTSWLATIKRPRRRARSIRTNSPLSSRRGGTASPSRLFHCCRARPERKRTAGTG
jgi:hypothetical protein